MLSRHSDIVEKYIFRVEISSSLDYKETQLRDQIKSIGIRGVNPPKIVTLYFLTGDLTLPQVNRLTETLILDPVTESYTAYQISDRVEKFNQEKVIEVAFRPGVTDNVAQQLLQAAKRIGIEALDLAATAVSYHFEQAVTEDQLHRMAKQLLVNETIQHYSLTELNTDLIFSSPSPIPEVEVITISTADAAELEAISSSRRLALDNKEMAAVKEYFRAACREPTDAELETIAQTWSEHCVHKTFKGRVSLENGEVIDGIIYKYLKSVTDQIDAPWVRSAFVDNAGVIEFDDQYDLSFKVETHNHPSAIEPFGGANTGVGGVVRDVLGVSHRPIANTDILCFGPQDMPYDQLQAGVLHPSRIQDGVVDGVGDYGNKLGIPTVNGAIFYHPGFTANPLVFCGCVGIGPVGGHPSQPKPSDRIIVLGGRTGRDGLRGATFSSLTMDAKTGEVAGASVQIGDPITEKGLIEVVEKARDFGLYNAITDCGAGGLSSAVGEMSSRLGAQVELTTVPLKYAGLLPWEIWLSEAQERMVLAVPQENIPHLQEICDRYWVELSDIGFIEETGELVVNYDGQPVVHLANHFLHKGIPQKELTAKKKILDPAVPSTPEDFEDKDYRQLLYDLLAHPNIASKEITIRKYDHEVRGATVIKPFAGSNQDGPNDGAVLKPLNTQGWRGFALANGVNPLIGESDPHYMALSVVDEAVRNLVAVGADPSRIALLDNFCWGNPSRPEIMASLVEAARGCYDAALVYQTPFISGKDSLNNEFIGKDGKRQSIPGTLLISSIGIVPDIRKALTADFKASGDLIYLVGDWQPTLAGSHILEVDTEFPGSTVGKSPGQLSDFNLPVYRAIFAANQAGLINALHDLSEGGLSVALAEMCISGRLGADVNINEIGDSAYMACFAETNGCLIAAIPPENQEEFEEHFIELPCRQIGQVSSSETLTITRDGSSIINNRIGDLWQAFAGHALEGQYEG